MMIGIGKLICGFILMLLTTCALVVLCGRAEHKGWPLMDFQVSGCAALLTALGQVVSGVLLAMVGLHYSAGRHLRRVSRSMKEESETIEALPGLHQAVELANSRECEKDAEGRLSELAGQVNDLNKATVMRFKKALCDANDLFNAKSARALLSEARAGMKEATVEQKAELDTVTAALYLRRLSGAGKAADKTSKALRGRGSLCTGVLIGITFCCYWPDPLGYGLVRHKMGVSASDDIPLALAAVLVVVFIFGASMACMTLGKYIWQAFEQSEETAWF